LIMAIETCMNQPPKHRGASTSPGTSAVPQGCMRDGTCLKQRRPHQLGHCTSYRIWPTKRSSPQCWKDGNRRGRHLFHDIKHRGYTGSFSNLECLLAAWRRAEKPEKEKGDAAPAWIGRTGRTYDNAPVRDPQTSHLISPIVAATLCIKPRGALTIHQARKVDALKQGSQTFAVCPGATVRQKARSTV